MAHQDRGWWAGVGLVPGLGWNRGMELAARLTGLMLVGSLVMSEACLWACQGGMRLVPVDMCTLVLCSVGAAPNI